MKIRIPILNVEPCKNKKSITLDLHIGCHKYNVSRYRLLVTSYLSYLIGLNAYRQAISND